MELIRPYFILLIVVLFSAVIEAQPVFTDKTRQFKRQIPTRSVMPGAMIDIDGDLIDDFVILDKGKILKIIKSSGYNFSLQLLDSIKLSAGTEWTLTAGDLNNDGDIEILTAGENNPVSITTIAKNKLSRKVIAGKIYAQGSNTMDINRDGWLDYLLCDDNGPCRIYLNDKSGNLILTEVIDFKGNDTTDGSGNYGTEWTDVNGDMLPDLCISKCRAGVTDPSDLRRINRLYINKGNGIFEESGAAYGLNSGEQTWVTTFGDIDNDGDQDAIVINHYGPHALMENIDGKYFREISLPEVLSSFSFQAVMRDFDNDGWLDILLAGVEGAILLHNKGNKSFDVIRNIIGPSLARSLTTGDINDDGFPDIHAHIGEPINDVGVKDDELWLNTPNSNHYLKINLEGKISNRSGIGARLEVYGAWGRQIRYVKGGESYGIFNSLQQHFGLGTSPHIDSLIVLWPSGIKDKYTDISADKTYLAQEGKCISGHVTLYSDIVLTTDKSVTLDAPRGYTTYLWNNNNPTASVAAEPGTYFVQMRDAAGCLTISRPIVVKSGCFTDKTKLIIEDKYVKLCAGQALTVAATPASSYLWNTGSTASAITLNSSGVFTLAAVDFCGRVLRDTVSVTFESVFFTVVGDTVRKGEKATLVSDDENTLWYASGDLGKPLFKGRKFVTEPLESTAVYFVQKTVVIDTKIRNVGEKQFPTSNLYGANSTAGGMLFSVEKPCILHSFKVNTDTDGVRRFIIKNEKGQLIFTKDILIKSGIQDVILDVSLKPGAQYSIATDEDFNTVTLGYKSPRFVRTFNSTAYPYIIENVLTILSSTFGAVYYYYFYDWEIQYDIIECNSDYQQVVAQVENNSSAHVFEYTKLNLRIIPNPAMEFVLLSGVENYEYIHIYDLLGRLVISTKSRAEYIDIRHLASGWYVVSTQSGNTLWSGRFYKL